MLESIHLTLVPSYLLGEISGIQGLKNQIELARSYVC
jgi:hypothetical protein